MHNPPSLFLRHHNSAGWLPSQVRQPHEGLRKGATKNEKLGIMYVTQSRTRQHLCCSCPGSLYYDRPTNVNGSKQRQVRIKEGQQQHVATALSCSFPSGVRKRGQRNKTGWCFCSASNGCFVESACTCKYSYKRIRMILL